MKSLKLASAGLMSLAVAAAMGLAVPTVSHAAPAADAGVKCPGGFAGSINSSGAFVCVEHRSVDVSNVAGTDCTRDGDFVHFQRMGNNQRDVCLHKNVDVSSFDNLAQLTNGKIVLTFPVGRPLPITFKGRATTGPGGVQTVILNPNADFIFYDQSNTLAAFAQSGVSATERAAQLAHLNDPLTRLVSVSTTKTDATGILDKIEAKIDLFVVAQP